MLKWLVLVAIAVIIVETAMAVPEPHSVEGRVFSGEGLQVGRCSFYTVNNTASGEVVQAETGFGSSNPGRYVTVINAETGNLIRVTAFNLTHTGRNESLITVAGTTFINVIMNEPHQITPEFRSDPITTVPEDSIYSYKTEVGVHFNRNQRWVYPSPLLYTLATSPAGMNINQLHEQYGLFSNNCFQDSALLDWLPGNSDVGTHLVTLEARDSQAAIDIQNFYLNVTPVNDPPEIFSMPLTQAEIGQLYTYQIEVLDIDNTNTVAYDDNTFSYELTTFPVGMDIAPNGEITWVPQSSGASEVSVRVSDGEFVAKQNFIVQVSGIVCGNGIVEGDEECEEGMFGNLSCSSFGFSAGNLACNNCQIQFTSCSNPACMDSDGGNAIYLLGTSCVGGSCSQDYCVYNDQRVLEHHCVNNVIVKTPYDCPNGCSSGACTGIQPTSCTDPDSSTANFVWSTLVKATTVTDTGDMLTDTCLQNGSPTVREYYCDQNSQIGWRNYICAERCMRGACTSLPRSVLAQ